MGGWAHIRYVSVPVVLWSHTMRTNYTTFFGESTRSWNESGGLTVRKVEGDRGPKPWGLPLVFRAPRESCHKQANSLELRCIKLKSLDTEGAHHVRL